MEFNFQLISDKMRNSNNSSDLVNYVDNGTELIFVDNFNSTRYSIVPKVFKYKSGKFYIKVNFNNSIMWITYNEFIEVEGKLYGIFKNDLELSKSRNLMNKGDI